MDNSLISYFNVRLKEEKSSLHELKNAPGPVITISREVGCNGLKLAKKIAKRLNSIQNTAKWRVLSKEIFLESAKELELKPESIKKIFKQTDKFIFDEILKAFSDKNYKSEKKIIKTIKEVIRSFAEEGYYIIVGKASHFIAHDIEKALHIRLHAPMEYRITNIMRNNNLTHEEADLFIQRVDKERISFRNALSGKQPEANIFDISFNRGTLPTKAIIDMIQFAAEKKGIFEFNKIVIQ